MAKAKKRAEHRTKHRTKRYRKAVIRPMQGIFINGRRPKSKKEIKDLVAEYNKAVGTHNVEEMQTVGYALTFQATSMFGGEFDGSLRLLHSYAEYDASDEQHSESSTYLHRGISFVGPDPYTNRKFYGTLVYDPQSETFKVS